MRLVERHVIDQNHQHWAEIDALSFKAKNLYLTQTVQLSLQQQ
ncbi:transposase [Nostoc sp. NIES-4103]|nr:transposase [Nostoc sp. NIES-4103]